MEETTAGFLTKDDVSHLEMEHERKTAGIQEDFIKQLQEQQCRKDAARRTAGQTAMRSLADKEQSNLTALERDKGIMQRKIEAFRLNQRVKEAELAAKLREEDELEAESLRQREQEEAEARLKAEESEFQQ